MYYIVHKKTGYFIGFYENGAVKTIYDKKNARIFECEKDAENWLSILPKSIKRLFEIVAENKL